MSTPSRRPPIDGTDSSPPADPSETDPTGHGAFGGHSPSPSVAVDGGRPRFTARATDRGVLVVADLRGVVRNGRETEVALSEDALVLSVDGRFVCRLPIDGGGGSSITDVSLNNDVLEARVALPE